MKHTGLLVVHGNFMKGSGMDTIFLHSKLSTDGTSAVVDVNDVKCSQYCLQVSVNVIYTLLKKAHVESGRTLSVLNWFDEASKHSQVCFYWKMILNFEVMLLIYMLSIREGNFELYLALLYSMLPWFFALDQCYYARCVIIDLIWNCWSTVILLSIKNSQQETYLLWRPINNSLAWH